MINRILLKAIRSNSFKVDSSRELTEIYIEISNFKVTNF